MALMMKTLTSEQYEGVSLYARATTEAGKRFSQVLGFERISSIEGVEASDIWKFTRQPVAPLYDSYIPRSGNKNIGITVARQVEDLLRVAAIRSAVYIGEQQCPYDEEYDGNDLVATHLIAYVGDEPAGCLRLRFFAHFVKLERVAIRSNFRKSRAAIQLVRAALKFCQKKGYGRIYGYSQAHLVNFWSRFGFRALENEASFVFSNIEHVEMVADLEPDPETITMELAHHIVLRPEGRWHVPGILERTTVSGESAFSQNNVKLDKKIEQEATSARKAATSG